MTPNLLPIIAAIGALGLVTAVASWQRLIWAVLFLVVCEGALRKFLPGLQAQIYLLKDALLIAAYAKFLIARPPSGKHDKAISGLRTWMLLTVSYCVLQLINPNSPSILVTAVGLKNYVLYMPLAFLVPYLFRSGAELENKLRLYAVVMIPFVALGLVQFSFGPEHWLNSTLDWDEESLQQAPLFGTGEMVRARTTGTFSYVGGYVTFLTVMFYLAAGLIVGSKWAVQGNRLVIGMLTLTLAAMFTTGSRTPFYGAAATAPIILWIWAAKGMISARQLIRSVVMCGVVLVIVQFLAPGAIDAYQDRVAHAYDTGTRLLSPFVELYGAIETSPIIGLGMGSAHASSMSIMQTLDPWWLQGNIFEVETARVTQEIGVIGFLLIYGCRIWLLVKAISLAMCFRTPLYVTLSSVIAGFFFQSIYLFVVNNPTAGIYYWFSAGLLFAMCRLESQALATLNTNAAHRPATVRSERVPGNLVHGKELTGT
jgi:hypothetical protein